MIEQIAQVAAGGALGASARYLSGVAAMRLIGPGFPWATVFVNVLGSLMMGILVVVLAEKGGMRFAPLLMVGLLGGFTTFSSFSLDAVTLYERGEIMTAALYVTGTVVASILALFAGLAASRWVLA